MKTKNKIIVIVIFTNLILFSSCKKSKFITLQDEVINKCITEIVNPDIKSIDSAYFINPYLNSFAFNNYTVNNYPLDDYTYKNKKKVLQKIGISDKDFLLMQKEIDNKYLGKYFSKLKDLSKGKKSYKLLTFSGISENLVFVEIITFCNAIDIKDLKGNNLYYSKKNIIKDITSLAIIIEKEKIKEVTVDNGIVFERQCDVTR